MPRRFTVRRKLSRLIASGLVGFAVSSCGNASSSDDSPDRDRETQDALARAYGFESRRAIDDQMPYAGTLPPTLLAADARRFDGYIINLEGYLRADPNGSRPEREDGRRLSGQLAYTREEAVYSLATYSGFLMLPPDWSLSAECDGSYVVLTAYVSLSELNDPDEDSPWLDPSNPVRYGELAYDLNVIEARVVPTIPSIYETKPVVRTERRRRPLSSFESCVVAD